MSVWSRHWLRRDSCQDESRDTASSLFPTALFSALQTGLSCLQGKSAMCQQAQTCRIGEDGSDNCIFCRCSPIPKQCRFCRHTDSRLL